MIELRLPVASEPIATFWPALSRLLESSPVAVWVCVRMLPSGSSMVVSVSLIYLKIVLLPFESVSLAPAIRGLGRVYPPSSWGTWRGGQDCLGIEENRQNRSRNHSLRLRASM